MQRNQERIDAAGVVLAAGGGSAPLIRLENVLKPRKGQLLVTERAGELNKALPGSLMSCRYLMSKAAAETVGAPSPRGFGLVVDPLRTGQFLIGGTREDGIEATGNDLEAVRRLLVDAVAILPGLAGLRLLRAFSGVRMSVCVLACSWIGGRSSSSRPMSCTISASMPRFHASQARRRAVSSSSSRRMVLSVRKMRAP